MRTIPSGPRPGVPARLLSSIPSALRILPALACGLMLAAPARAGVVPAPHPMYAGAEQTEARLLYVGQGGSGGRLAIDNHAEFMVTRDDSDVVQNWNNCGTFKWSFGRYGYDGPATEYPLFDADLNGSPAVTFDGGDKLRMIPEGNTPLPTGIADGVLSVELWVRNPTVQAGEVLVRFEDTTSFDLTAAQFGMTGSTAWQHLVAVSNGTQITFYKNNVQVGSPQPGALSFSTNAIINLGAQSLTGSIAAIRIHTEPMNAADIAHNFNGGVMLGTYLFYNINANKLDDMVQGDPTLYPGDRETRESKHFRSIWTPSENPDPGDDIAARVMDKQMGPGEVTYDWMAHKLGLHMPIVSTHEHLRGDGRKYKIHHGNKWTGGDFMGYAGDTGFGWGFTYAGWFNDHELLHGVQAHQMGSITGHWWETHANFGPSYAGYPHVNPVDVCPQHSHVYPSTGGNYYHAYLIWEHLAEVPEYGPLYSTRVWNIDPAGSVYPPKAMRDMDLDLTTPFDDEWVRMAARCVTWDFSLHPEFKTRYDQLEYTERTHLIMLQEVPYLPVGWYEPPKWRAPQQHGYNMCPLEVNPGTVTADLAGFIDPIHGSDWRGMFVAVETDGSPRYSDVFSTAAQGTFQVQAGDQELYLVVSATPDTIMGVGIFGGDSLADYRGPAKDRFPYQVKLGGTTPKVSIWQDPTPNSDGPHPNGGGFVAGTARVDAGVYVGPGAKVLDHARVFGSARIEDNAIVSGYAIVESGAIVRDEARVGDFAQVGNNAIIQGEGKVIEHASIGNGQMISDFGICKGNAYVNGPVHGTGIVDGNYIKTNDVDKGYWFNWSWGSGQAVGELDEEFNQLYLEYQFEQEDAYRVWDSYGITWGRLLNGPAYIAHAGGSALQLDGVDDFIDLHQSVARKDAVTFEIDVNWDGGSAGQRLLNFSNSSSGDEAWLSPSDSQGKLAFGITVGGVPQIVQAAAPLPSGAWYKVQVMTEQDNVLLYVDGVEWASGTSITHDLEDVKANECYVGRGPGGNYFDGAIDNYVVWSKSLIESSPPSPNPAGFAVLPTTIDGNRVMMHAIQANDANLPVEYYFEETSGNIGASDSGWQTSRIYYDGGLAPGTTYTYVVRARDALGNTTANSAPANITTPTLHPGYFVQEPDDSVSIEVENYDHKQTGTLNGNNWVSTTSVAGYSGAGGMRVPDAGRQINSGYAPAVSPRMDYAIRFDEAGTYRIFIRGYGVNPGADSCHAGLNMEELSGLATIASFDTAPGHGYDWIGNKTFEVPFAGVHILNIWMREDGTILDKIVIKRNGSFPSGTGPAESSRGGSDPVIAPTPPVAPTGLALAPGPAFISVSWDANTESDLLGYNLYRGEFPGGPYTKLNADPLTATSFTDTTTMELVTYYYVVRALDEDLSESSPSAEVAGAAEVDFPPAAPSGLAAETKSGYIQLTWDANIESDLAGYHVYRAASETGDYVRITDNLLTPNAYPDGEVIPLTTYWYKVSATDLAGGASGLSSPVSGSADPLPTYPPGTTVSINVGGNGSLAPGDVTGVNQVANWNDFSNVSNPTSSALVDSGGALIPLLSFSATGDNTSFNHLTNPDHTMISSWIFTPSVSFSGIPFPVYDLVIYYDSWAQVSGNNSSLMKFDLSSGGSPVGPGSVWAVNQKDFRFEPNSNPDWDAYSAPSLAQAQSECGTKWDDGTDDGGYHFVVENLTASSLDLAVSTVSGSTAGISGLQIIAATDPNDTDRDGLPDLWEDEHFGDKNGIPTTAELAVSDGSGDFDDDGFSDLAEFRLGLIPSDPNSTFTLDISPGAAGAVSLSWPSQDGLHFEIYFTEDLSLPLANWSVIPIIDDDGDGAPTHEWTDADPAPSPPRFYRVGLLP